MKGKFIYLLQFLISFLILVVLGNSSINMLIYPFAFSMAFALLWSGVQWWIIIPSYALSAILFGFDLSNLLNIFFVSVFLFLPFLFRFITKKSIKKWFLCVCLVFSHLLNLIFVYNDFVKIIHLAITVCLGVLFFLSCSKLFDSVKTKSFLFKFSNFECLCGSLILIALSGGFVGFSIGGFEFFKLIVPFVLLCVSYCTRKSLVLIVGALFALGSILPAGNVIFVAPIIFWSLGIIVFKSNKKLFSAMSVVFVESISGFVLNLYYSYSVISFLPVIIAAFIFFILPNKTLDKFRVLYESKNSRLAMKNVYNQGRELIGRRLENLSNVFYDMNLVFKAMLKKSLTENDIKIVLYKEIKKKVCETCPEKARCHRAFCEDTSKSFEELISKSFAKGKVSILDVPAFLNSRCDKVNLIISNVNSLCVQYKKYSDIIGSIDTSKLLIADQLYGVSHVIRGLSKEIAVNVSFDNVREEKIKEELSFNNIVCSDAIVYDKNIHEKEVSIVVRNEDQAKAILPSIVSQICDTKMIVANRTVALEPGWTNLTLRNAPKYDCAFGLSIETKSGSNKSGDCHSEIRLSESKFLFAICDGMGSGEKAQDTSNVAISLIENFYRAGFDNDTILSSVNKLLLLQREENFSAIDICVVDLDSGIVDIIKMGSPSGYILTKDSIKIVEGGTLPLGIVGESKAMIKKYVIDENEYMIMMSDGISDSFANDRLLCDFISRLKTRNPQDMADAIKMKAIENNNGRAIDDMSVLVVKIFAC